MFLTLKSTLGTNTYLAMKTQLFAQGNNEMLCLMEFYLTTVRLLVHFATPPLELTLVLS